MNYTASSAPPHLHSSQASGPHAENSSVQTAYIIVEVTQIVGT